MCYFWFLISWSLLERPTLNCCNLSWANVACHMLNYLFFKKASTWSILFGLHTYMALYFPICASCIVPIRLTQMQEAVVFVFLHLCQLFPLDNKICYFASNIMDVCEGPHQACQKYWPRSTHYHSTTREIINDRSKKVSLMTSKS